MEVIDIGLSDLEPITLSLDDALGPDPRPSVNFGPGIELLMNDKQRGASMSTSVDLGDLDKLENELNDLADTSAKSAETRSFGGFAANLFGLGSTTKTINTPLANGSSLADSNDSKLGSATVEGIGSTKTWDGFGKMGDAPVGTGPGAPRMTDREKRRKKRAMLKKLEEWYEKGQTKHNSHFNMDSNYEEIEDEFETVMEDKRKKDSVKLQGWWFMTFVNSIEYGNAVFDPFGLNLDGWGEQVSEDIESYEEIFNELHEKYKGGKLSPEISLLLRLGFSAAVVNITNKALSTATPGFNDVIRQSPELMKMFTSATVNSMNQNSPGFGFVNSVLHPDEKVNTSYGAPPAPVETKSQAPPQRPGSMNFTQAPGNRPDLAMGRGTMFRESGVDMSSSSPYENARSKPMNMAPPQSTRSDGPLRSETPRPDSMPRSESTQSLRSEPQQSLRSEMRGPQNLDMNNLLSGLKTREVNIHDQSNRMMSAMNMSLDVMDENDSMVSISSLRDTQNSVMPKRANRRKQRSDKNTISLDI